MHTSALWQVAHPYVSCAIKFTIILFRWLQWCYPNCTQLFFPLLQTKPVSIKTDTEKVALHAERVLCTDCIHTALKWFGLSALLILQSVPSWKQQLFSADCGIHLTFHISTVLFMPHGVIKHCAIKKGCYWDFFVFVLFFIWGHSLCDSTFCRTISNYLFT